MMYHSEHVSILHVDQLLQYIYFCDILITYIPNHKDHE